jgi:hypothetical protein
MRVLVSIVLLSSVLLASTGCVCYTTPVKPPLGGIYTDIKAPLTENFHNTPVCQKSGQSSSLYVNFYLQFGWDKASIEAAMKNGGLKKVEYADYRMQSVLGIFGQFTVTAYGY